ncbi:MAG: SGNH/GDSL hydrolase family protein [Gallionella sp.]
MFRIKLVSVVFIAMILSSCGGGGDSEAPAKPQFSSQVSFGDSLSDVGSYKVGEVATQGGGQYTINDATGAPTNWTEFIAPQFGLPAPCAAQTGIDDGGTNVIAVVNNPACTGYGQGGARVTDPVGIGNKASVVSVGLALTVPVVTQIANHLAANGGSFSGDEIVYVMAGANDIFHLSGLVSGAAITLATAVTAAQTAATELAGYVTTEIVGKGAKYVVVMNVPDIGSSPQVTSITDPTLRAQAKGLLDALVSDFNTQLATDLPDSTNVMNVDAFTASSDEVANPAKYNLTNVTDVACGANAFGTTSLACNATNLAPGASATHLFADAVHPTPYGNELFATYVLQEMVNKGWY